jgi:hypothetical protein
MEDKWVEHKKQDDQENIMLKKQSTLSPTNNEEIRHAHNSRDDNKYNLMLPQVVCFDIFH